MSCSQDRANSVNAPRRAGPAPGAPKPRVPARSSRCAVRSMSGPASLQGVRAALAGAHAGDVIDGYGPGLAVADPAGLGRLEDHLDHRGGVDVVDEHLHPDLGHEVDGVLRAAVDLAVPALATVPAGLADRHTGDPEGLQGLLHLLELVRLDDGGDELHAGAPCVVVAVWGVAAAAPGAGGEPPKREPPLRVPRSYDVSACWSRSIPATSASRSTRKPSTFAWTVPMAYVSTKEKARTAKAPPACRHSWSTPPP